MNIHSKYSIIYLYIKYRHTSKRLATMPTRLFPLNARMSDISNTKNVINHISGLKDENLVIISIDANKKPMTEQIHNKSLGEYSSKWNIPQHNKSYICTLQPISS